MKRVRMAIALWYFVGTNRMRSAYTGWGNLCSTSVFWSVFALKRTPMSA